MVTHTDIFLFNAKRKEPVLAEIFPIIEPLKVGIGFAEEFAFHLLKFAGSENKVTGGYLVAEGLTNLANTERKFLSCCSLNICKVYENTLSSFGAEVNLVFSILSNTDKGFEHKVEFSDICKIGFAAFRANNAVFFDIGFHLLKGHTLGLAAMVFNKLICSMASAAALAVHQRI